MTIQDLFIFNISDYIFEKGLIVGYTIEIYSRDLDIKDYIEITNTPKGYDFRGHISSSIKERLEYYGFNLYDLRNTIIEYYKSTREV